MKRLFTPGKIAIFSMLICILAILPLAWKGRGTAPEWRADPISQRIAATPDGKPIIARYEVRNIGGANLRLETSSTSCGCTVAAIEPSILEPGQSGQIRVEGTPPAAGEKPIQVVVTTNATKRPDIHLELIMVGTKPPPLIEQAPGSVEFGVISPGERSQSVMIRTLEKEGSKPWLNGVSANPATVSVSGGMVLERSAGNATMAREYRFDVELKGELKPGQFLAQLDWISPESGRLPVLSIPIHGQILPPVYASPSTLFASVVPGEEPPQLKVSIHCPDDDSRPFEVTPSGDGHDRFVSIKKLDRQKDRISFAVTPKLPIKSSIATNIVFQTNHTTTPQITLPVHIQLSSYDK